MYDVRNKPVTGDYTKSFFGCLPSKHGLRIVANYKTYMDQWNDKGKTDEERLSYWATVDSYEFWSNRRATWRELAEVALWWLEVPTSSIAAERAFALLRQIALPTRGSLSRDSYRAELSLRVNMRLVEDMQHDDLQALTPAT